MACRDNLFNNGQPEVESWLDDSAVDGFLFRGNEGFSLERRGFWRKRFSELALLPEAKTHVKELASEALGEMVKLENHYDARDLA